jgi:hypothetical protein
MGRVLGCCSWDAATCWLSDWLPLSTDREELQVVSREVKEDAPEGGLDRLAWPTPCLVQLDHCVRVPPPFVMTLARRHSDHFQPQ